MALATTADITSSKSLHKLNWNLRYHLRQLSKLSLEAKRSHFRKYAFESNLEALEGYYNQLAFMQMNHQIAEVINERAFNRLFNAIALTALAS
tara:strand:+ start:64 stop:342 length:279 start_codon:yes stop_codon:yes gene_type:complete